MTSNHDQSAIEFPAEIEIRGINPYVLVSAETAARLKPGWRKPMPVRVQINGEPDPPWRINMMPVGDGCFYLYLRGQVREASETRVGDWVTVTIMFDDEYRGGPADPMPLWFAEKLERDQAAKRGWEGLSPSRQKEILRYLAGLRSKEARERNTERALHVLAGGKARFMARAWNG